MEFHLEKLYREEVTMEMVRISGAGLKRIAMCCMFLDHFAAVLLKPAVLLKASEACSISYWMLCGIGRIAFPIYCFLLIEGFLKTRNTQNYMLRLGLCGLGSEIPYDLAFSCRIIDWNSQNVLFTLFLGLMALVLIKRLNDGREGTVRRSGTVMTVVGVVLLAVLAEFIRCDYGAVGVFLIVSMYLFHRQETWRDIVSGMLLVVLSPFETVAAAAIPLIHLYNGERGKQSKYGMYLFYPGHLLLLSTARQIQVVLLKG
jgi:hypothetical protein